MRHVISLAVTDLRAEVVYSEVVDLSGRTRVRDPGRPVLDALCGADRQDTAEQSRRGRLDQVVGIGIGLAGLVDAETGCAVTRRRSAGRTSPWRSPLAERLGRPVLVDNDVNTLTVAEQWFGRGHGVDDFVVVTVGEGVGAGIVVDGRLYRGARGAAGEIGHMRLDGSKMSGAAAGRAGCLEAASSDGAVRRYLAEAVRRGETSADPKR